MNVSRYRIYPNQKSTSSGSGSTEERVVENLSSQINSSNTTILTISRTPSSGGVQLSLNGQILVEGSSEDYTFNNKTITFVRTDIEIGDSLVVSYIVTN